MARNLASFVHLIALSAMLVACAGNLPSVEMPALPAGKSRLETGTVERDTLSLAVPVTSIRARRFLTTIRQQADFSCGSAAVATLLTFHYLQPTTETEVFRAMIEGGDMERIRTAGFSLLDMQRYLAQRGFRSNGFRVPLDRLEQARVPAIVLVNTDGYRHFLVLRGIRGNRVLLADPNQGTRVMSRAGFERIWNGIAFVILDQTAVAQATFGASEDWAVLPAAPVQATRLANDGWRVGLDALNNRFF